MRKRVFSTLGLLLVVIVMGIFVFSGSSFAAEFSADFLEHEEGELTAKGKIYVKGNKIRLNVAMLEEGEVCDRSIVILRPDKGVMWWLNDQEKKYWEMPYQTAGKHLHVWSSVIESKAKYLGKETISGVSCKKYQTTEDGEKTYFWISEKSPWPIRTKDEEAIMELKNIKESPILNPLFEIPPGYKKMSTMMPGMSE